MFFRKQIIRFPCRSIYNKDNILNKEIYQPSEKEQLEAYIKNYMQDDPKNISEEEKARLLEQMKQLKSTMQQGTKMEGSKSFSIIEKNTEISQDGKAADPEYVVNPKALKDIFDKMVEIDSDPNSKRAQEYYQQLEDMERKNPNKKKSHIIIKTMKRGRTVSKETYADSSFIGKKLSEDEKQFHKKYIDYKDITFPELNPIEMKVQGQGKTLKLANFRFPSLQVNRKGIIYYNNGYGDYCARYAYLAKEFAQAGYDFVCMDNRGFGQSDGRRAYVESEEALFDDVSKFHDAIDDKFGGKDVPKFQLGISLGGISSVKLSVARPNFYKGMGLIVPYFKLVNQAELDRKMGIIKLVNRFWPTFSAPIPATQWKAIMASKFLREINIDPLVENKKIPIRNLVVNEQSLKKFREKEADNVTTPFIMILGGRDQIVDNRAAKEFFDIQSSKVQDKDIITYDDADHFICLDNEFMPLLTKDLIGWFNTHQ